MIEIKQVLSKKELTQFIDFPHELYKNDNNYVPELFLSQADLLSKKHPFFIHSEADYFLAYLDGKAVGRIAAIKNNNYIEYTGERAGSFGFFDFIDNYDVAVALLDKVSEWLKEKGLVSIIGPHNYSTNETCGILIEGFDLPPTVMMPYNKPFYSDFLERYGFEKDMDLLSYKIMTKDVPDKLLKMAPKILKRLNSKGITIRKPNMKKFEEEVEIILEIYNKAWEKNWGFVPMTDEEFRHSAKDIKQILDPDFLLIAEHDGVPIGFSLSVPDMNIPSKHVKKGRLLPLGIFKLLYHRKKVDRVRIVILGVVESYRKLGIDAYFYAKAFEEAKNKKMLLGEASWILENNEMMNKALININGHVYKKHRLYKRAIEI